MFRNVIKENKYFTLTDQPVALFTVSQNRIHIRQTVQSASHHSWKLDFKSVVNYHLIKNIKMTKVNNICTNMVLSNHGVGVALNKSDTFQDIITELSTTQNLNKGVICSLKANLKDCKFPADEGMLILAFIRSSAINNRKEKTKTVGKKIKIKLMMKDTEFQQVMTRNKLESLSQDLTQEIVVRQKIVVGTSWGGRFYVAKKQLINTTPKNIRLDSMEAKFNVSEYEYYVDYDEKDKALSSMSEFYEHQQSSKVKIGLTGFEGIYPENLNESLGASLYALIKEPREKLEGLFKYEFNASMKRIKIWHRSCFYYFECKTDIDNLGGKTNFNRNMKVARGVRKNNGFAIPAPLMKLQSMLTQTEILSKPVDAIAMNLYYAEDAEGTSGIEFHGEDDRYELVVSCVLTSGPDVQTYFSINQHGLHGTTEVDVLSVGDTVWRFDS